LITGGTGVTQRDRTPDVVQSLGTKEIPGFGELFRWLSYQDIGSSTIQSRATAWVCTDTLVFALPGSTNAVKLALDQIILPQLDVRNKPCNFAQLMPRIKVASLSTSSTSNIEKELS
jgi:molybdenum cofactor biosynthesis protein B